jgi:hypothetical protein
LQPFVSASSACLFQTVSSSVRTRHQVFLHLISFAALAFHFVRASSPTRDDSPAKGATRLRFMAARLVDPYNAALPPAPTADELRTSISHVVKGPDGTQYSHGGLRRQVAQSLGLDAAGLDGRTKLHIHIPPRPPPSRFSLPPRELPFHTSLTSHPWHPTRHTRAFGATIQPMYAS